ncbi:MAG TPA: hypothetical protein VEU06_00560 [Micropepsaceae bacterium]|nr:hypothetical protein [Micropepsaceae bacterium]
MAVADAAVSRFQIGRVASRTFGVIGNNIVPFTLLALLPGVPAAFMYWGWYRFAAGLNPLERHFDLGAFSTAGVAGLIYFVAYFVFQAAVVHSTVAYLNGKRASFADALSTGLANFFPLFVLSILVGLGVLGGMILLLVPGIILALMWSVAVPVRVVEHSGITAALGRSSELTRGHRWAIFGLAVAFVIFEVIVGAVFGGLSAAQFMLSASGDPAAAMRAWTTSPSHILASTFAAIINLVIVAAGTASVYYELRVVKEGIGPEALAAVFD